MDLNLPRRRPEMAIAQKVADELLRKVSMVQAAQPKVIAHHFATVCQRLGVTVDNSSTGRILRYTMQKIIRREKQVEGLTKQLDKVTEAFNQARV
jgi:hypothetical protein